MSFTGDLLAGLAQYLADAGAGIYRAAGDYQADEIAIVFGVMPEQPDSVILLSPYPVTDDPSLSDSVVAIQARCRAGADLRDVEAIADTVFDVLHGATQFDAGAVRVVDCYRQSGVPLGQDQNNRLEHADNYYLTVHRPSTHRE